MQLGLQLERLTQPDVVDADLGRRMGRMFMEGGRDGLPGLGGSQDFARGMRESKAMLERERWPRERLERSSRSGSPS